MSTPLRHLVVLDGGRLYYVTRDDLLVGEVVVAAFSTQAMAEAYLAIDPRTAP